MQMVGLNIRRSNLFSRIGFDFAIQMLNFNMHKEENSSTLLQHKLNARP
jgi:hypothetical protein